LDVVPKPSHDISGSVWFSHSSKLARPDLDTVNVVRFGSRMAQDLCRTSLQISMHDRPHNELMLGERLSLLFALLGIDANSAICCKADTGNSRLSFQGPQRGMATPNAPIELVPAGFSVRIVVEAMFATTWHWTLRVGQQ
jgi:hypothetical protein